MIGQHLAGFSAFLFALSEQLGSSGFEALLLQAKTESLSVIFQQFCLQQKLCCFMRNFEAVKRCAAVIADFEAAAWAVKGKFCASQTDKEPNRHVLNFLQP